MPKAISTLAVGAKVEIPVLAAHQTRFGNKVVFKVADKNHSGYPANSVTLITDKIIQMLCFDGKEPNNTNSDRQKYGNNRYLHANLRQWLNSNAAAGAWYSAQHAADAPPNATNASSNAYDGIAGFLAIFDPKFAAALLETTLTVARNTVTDGGSYETVTDKVFLASNTEVGLANENSIAEGALLPLFSDNASRITQCTQAAITASNDSSKPANTSAAWYWWLRTPHSSIARNVRHVSTDGALSNYFAYYGRNGVRPLCNLKSEILVSDNVNADGNYEVIWNTAPVISGSDDNLGTKTAGFSQTYTVSDADEDNVTVTETIDGVLIRSYSVVLGATNTFSVTGETWLKLTNGSHSMTITATDSFGNSSERTYTFTKSVSGFTIQNSEPYDSDTRPVRIKIRVARNIPAESTFKVYVCNNGFDASPTWEDATTSVTGSLVHVFENETKTGVAWGVLIKVEVTRGDGEGACYVSQIGGNFE